MALTLYGVTEDLLKEAKKQTEILERIEALLKDAATPRD